MNLHVKPCQACGRRGEHDCGYSLRRGQAEGAAVAFGLMGMALAIHENRCLWGEHDWYWHNQDDCCYCCGITGTKFDAASDCS
jgi:hypothetical protein